MTPCALDFFADVRRFASFFFYGKHVHCEWCSMPLLGSARHGESILLLSAVQGTFPS